MNCSTEICFGIDDQELPNISSDKNIQTPFYDNPIYNERDGWSSLLTTHIAPLVLAATIFTFPLQYCDPVNEFLNSGAPSFKNMSYRKVRRYMSVYEVLKQTRSVFTEAERKRANRRAIDVQEILFAMSNE